MTLTAKNLQIAVQTTAPSEILEPVEHLDSGRLFCELVRKLPVELPVVVERRDGQVLLSVVTMEIALNNIVDDEFPEYPSSQEKVISLTDY